MEKLSIGEYTIPEGMEAIIENGKIILREKEDDDERVRKEIYNFLIDMECKGEWIAYIEKQKQIVQWPNLSNCKHDCKTCFARCIYRKEQNEEQKPAEYTSDSALQKIKRAITDCKKLSEHYKDTEENFHQYYGGKADGLQLALFYLGNENEQSLEEQKPAEKSSMLKKLKEHLANTPREQLDAEFEVLKDLTIDKPAEQNMREQIISKAKTERQVVLISESNDRAEINWDTRSLEDTKALLEWGLTFINKQLGIKSSEWSEKDKEMLIKVGQIVLKHWNSLSDSFYHKHDDENEDAESCYNWIKYLPDRFNLESKRERGEEACLNETKQECSSIDISGSIKNSHIKALENLLSYLKYERKTTQTEINTSFIPCLENLLKDAENTNGHVECIKFDNEFENQVSYLLASILNGEHEYSSGFIKYAAQSLLGQAKNELKLTKWNDVTINGEPIPTEEQSVDISLTNWSEDIIRKAVKEVGLTQRQIDWFKTNVFPPKQEWGEEDRRTIDRACVALRAYANGELPDILPSEILGYADKLQSIRPSWKPSEEQESVAEQFAKIVRANLSEINEKVQQEFEHLYYKITGNKMYGGYND